MSRQDVRVGIAEYFGGAVLDSRRFYRPTPLQAAGLSGVKAYFTDRIDDNRDYFEGLAAGATFGAVMCVHIAATTETRLTTGGTLNRPYSIELYLYWYAVRQPPETAQASADDLLDAVEDRIRADPTLGMGVGSGAPTIVTQAGEGARGISVNSPPAYTEPDKYTMGSAVISFDAATYPNIA